MNLPAYNPDKTLVEQYRSATVVGLGATGYSVVRYLRARGLDVAVMDSRTSPPLASELDTNYPEVATQFGGFEDSSVNANALMVVSPGVTLLEPVLRKARQMGAHLIGDIELFIQENKQAVIAVTGSNGKSTVVSLVGKMCEAGGLSVLVAGNIGLPVLDALTDEHDYQIAVLELSSFQLETTSRISANAVAILNISPDHMDRYNSMGDYVLAKTRILRAAKRVVLPRHDEQLRQVTSTGHTSTFALDEPSSDSDYGIKQMANHRWLVRGTQRLIKRHEIPLLGLHNVANVLAAFALVEDLNLSNESLCNAVRGFRGLAHRMQTVCVANTVTWVNDSKATNIGATSTAIRSLEQDVIWIAGGQGKGADFSELRNAVSSNIKLLILMGEDADQMQSALQDLVTIKRVKSMQDAVELAVKQAQNGSIVLLSPACASFDMYQSYEHRGDDFIRRVKACVLRGAA